MCIVLALESSKGSGSVIWMGKPWIVPSVLFRTILVLVVAIIILWLEFAVDIAYQFTFGVSLAVLTGLAFFVIWVIGVVDLLLLRTSNTYVLRNDSLEVKQGIISTSAFVIAPAGFGSMEVIKSLSGRLINRGDIVIRTQDPNDRDKWLVMLKDPERAASQIREVMARPIVRLDK